jgi:Holliday junction DNA helicase RuvB
MTMTNAAQAQTGDAQLDRALRPSSFDGFLGQEGAKRNLRICVHGALSRGEPLDHVLLAGPPGLGKTTLAGILAAEMGARLVVVNAPGIKTKGELASLLTSLRRGDVLFLDEIHSLNAKIEEVLYPAMEDYRLEVVAGNKALTIALEPFTLIGATTRAGMLQRPLRDRFGVTVNMVPYSVEELRTIAEASARKLGVALDGSGAEELARRSRGTPRIANRLLRRVRDFALYEGLATVDAAAVSSTCDQLGVDAAGLDPTMRRYLRTLCEKNGPVALSTMVALLGESKDVVEDVIEPFLLRLGLIERTPRGRVATAAGNAHMYGVM